MACWSWIDPLPTFAPLSRKAFRRAAMTHVDALNEAIPVYLGYGFLAEPEPDLSRVVDRFGGDEAWRLRTLLEELAFEVDHIKPSYHPNWQSSPEEANSEWVAAFIGSEYPHLDDKARAALAWFWVSRNL
jgi:hypothetical protein